MNNNDPAQFFLPGLEEKTMPEVRRGRVHYAAAAGRKVEQQACWLKIPLLRLLRCSGCHASLTVSTLSPTSTETPFTLYIHVSPLTSMDTSLLQVPANPALQVEVVRCPLSVSTVSVTGVGWGGGGC